jgi:hypothetical protein
MSYDPIANYWIVAIDPNQVFSSASGALVPFTDATYKAWLAAGNLPSRTGTWAELSDILQQQAPAAWTLALPTLEASGGLTPQQMLAARLASPVQVTSNSNSLLNGNYWVDASSQAKLTALAAGIAAGQGLPGGGGSVGIIDAVGATHIFNTPSFTSFAAAIELYIYQLYSTESALLAGASANWPPPSLAIP